MSFPMYLIFGISSVPWGYVADRWNPRLVMAAGIGLAALGLIGVGLISDVQAIPWLLALVGFGNAAYHPTGLSLISKGMRLRGRAMGINGVFGNLGIAFAPFAAGALALYLGWRGAFQAFGILGIIIAIAITAVPFSVSRLKDRQNAEGAQGSVVLILFLLLCTGVLFSGLVYRSFTLVLPSWLEERISRYTQSFNREPQGRESFFAAMISSLAMFIGMGGQMFGGFLADRIDLKKAYVLFFASTIPCLLAGIFIPGWISILFIGLFTFFLLGIQPIENSLYAILIPPKWRSSGFGIKFTLGFGVGSLAIRIVSFSESKIGLGGVMLLIAGYLCATVVNGIILLLAGRRTSLKHV